MRFFGADTSRWSVLRRTIDAKSFRNQFGGRIIADEVRPIVAYSFADLGKARAAVFIPEKKQAEK
jgi:hypothetical protein